MSFTSASRTKGQSLREEKLIFFFEYSWLFCSSFIVVLLPLWESRVALGDIARGIAADLSGKRRTSSPSS